MIKELVINLTTIEVPQENESDMLFKVEADCAPKRCPECGWNTDTNYYGYAHSIKEMGIQLQRKL